MSAEQQALLARLQCHIGANAGIRIEPLTRAVFGPNAGEAYQRRVRKLVEALRRKGHHICADPVHGYFIAKTEKELNETCGFLYRRALTSLTQISAMKRVSLPDLAGQLNIQLEEPTP